MITFIHEKTGQAYRSVSYYDRYLVISAVWCWAGWLVMKCIGDMTTDNSNLRLV